ncbi:class II aldolase/adducin family protein [Streptomyces sp. NPDC058256]|uniref:class II aldolase/adducin family protein n=1 Tax=Streptomyces sp. NPDC058256 TaxID=3346408 RepID=UPI0036EB60E2
MSPGYLADTATGLPIPAEATFTSPDTERRHRKQRLAATLRIFGKYGFGEGISGHVSVRDPEFADRFWVSPFGVSFNRVRVADLLCADEEGNIIEGRHKLNPSAFVIHSAIHRQYPHLDAAAHAHTINSRALSAVGHLLEPVDQESTAFYRRQALYTDYEGPTTGAEQGRDIADKLADAEYGTNRAMLLKHHGVITVGECLEEAVHWFLTWDSCARVQLLARAAGPLETFTPEQAGAAARGFGDQQLARFSFNLLWDEIIHEQPDLLDEE